MNIRRKIGFLFLGHLVVFLVGLQLIEQFHRSQVTSVLSSIRKERMEQFATALNLKSEGLRATVYDYTYWGDFADFVAGKKAGPDESQWTSDNLKPALTTFKMDFLGAYNLSSELAYSVMSKEGEEEPIEMAEPPLTAQERLSVLSAEPGKQFCLFFLPTERGFMETHGAMVYGGGDTERTGPTYGMLFMGRLWTDEVLKEIARVTNSSLELYPGSVPPPADQTSPMSVEFNYPLPGMQGAPVGFLRVRAQPAFLREFLRGWRLQVWMFVGFIAVLGLSLGWGMKRWVMNPLRKLSSALDRGDAEFLKGLAGERSEFGRVSKLLGEFFRQQQKLKDSEERYRALVNDIPGAVYARRWDKDWTMDFASNAIQDITGHPPASFVDNKLRTFASVIHADDRARADDTVAAAVLDKSPYVIEYRLVAADHSVKWVYEKGQAVFDARGNVKHLEGVIFDVTEKKAMESKLMQSQKMETVGTLAAGIAHDLNNQLTPLLGYLDLLMAQMPPENPDRELIGEAEQAARRSADIVQRLVRFSRPSSQKKNYVSMQKLFAEAVKTFAKFLPSTIELEMRASEDVWPALINETEIHTVLMNLAANARDAMPQGGKLGIKAENMPLEFAEKPAGLPPGPCIRITVTDTGKGMTPDIKARIFEPFFTTKKGGGSGLGLAMVFNILKDHKGVIEVSSKPDYGTSFQIYLPALPDAKVLTEPTPDFSKLPRAKEGEVILLADDEEPVRNAARFFLEHLGYRVITAEDGEVAVRLFAEHAKQISAILLDMTMPKLTGRQCMRHLLQLKPLAKIVLCSGFTSEGSPQELMREGAKDFVFKPYTIESLAGALRRTIDSA